ARVVIVGGGVAGVSIAYHLAQAGCRDVVVLERGELTGGSTFHAAGLVGQLRSSVELTRINMASVELYRRLLEETGRDPGWKGVGSLRVASSPARLAEMADRERWARRFGLHLELVGAREARERFPLMTDASLEGALWLPSDGHVDPAGLANALADGAKGRGVKFLTGARVVAITVKGGRVAGVVAEGGPIACEVVVNGPEAYTPDGEFILGEAPKVGGFFVAVGFCAHGIAGAGGVGKVMAAWILDGRPPMDLRRMDVRRFGPDGREPPRAAADAIRVYATYYDIREVTVR